MNSRNFEVWPMFLFLNVIFALEGTLKDLFYSKPSQFVKNIFQHFTSSCSSTIYLQHICYVIKRSGPEVINFFMLNSAEHEFVLLINVKMLAF